MANSFTTWLNLEKPEVGADANLWGGHTNSNWDIVDSIFTSNTARPISTIIKSDTKIVDATTTSRSILWSLSAINTTSTRTYTVPNTSGTMALLSDVATATTGVVTTGALAAATATTIVMNLTAVQTATNKTLTAPLLTGILAASTGVTTTAASNNARLATTAYADRVGVQQVVVTQTGAVNTGTTLIPLDDTIPQNTEGDEYMTLAVVPRSATSKLVIEITFCATQNIAGANNIIVALFQDSTADALAAAYESSSNQFEGVSLNFTHEMASATTSSTTFKVRAGLTSAATLTFNGVSAGRLFGGVMASSIMITEIGM